MTNRFWFLFLFVCIGCTTSGPVHMTEVECRLNSDCAEGSYCDSFTGLCGWDCRDNDECAPGMRCDPDNGRCIREEELPSAPDHIGPVLEVVAGDLSDTTIIAGTDDAELFRYDIVNHSDRNVILRLLPISIHLLDGDFAGAGSFTDVKVTDRADNYVRMGPQDLDHEAGAVIYLEDEFTLPAGETTTLVLRADVSIAETYSVRAGSLRGLIEDAIYADAPESVPFERIRNNSTLGRNIHVLPADMGTMPSGTTALVVTFTPEHGILHPAVDYGQRIGTITLESFGGDSVFRGTRVTGANIGVFSGLYWITPAGTIESVPSTPIGACSCGEIRMISPLLVRDGERHQLTVYADVASDAPPSEVTFSPNGSDMDAGSASGGPFRLVVSSHGESRFRVYRNHPIVELQALPTTTLVNGLDMELFRVLFAPAVPGESLFIGSMTLRFNGVAALGGYIENLRVRVGSTELPRGQYRIFSTVTGEETTEARRFAEQITIVFARDLGGLGISSSGDVITVVGRPSGFTPDRDGLDISFGDRIFTGASPYVWGSMTYDGRISAVMGDYGSVDPIVWSTGPSMGYRYTGAWEIEDLTGSATLSH